MIIRGSINSRFDPHATFQGIHLEKIVIVGRKTWVPVEGLHRVIVPLNNSQHTVPKSQGGLPALVRSIKSELEFLHGPIPPRTLGLFSRGSHLGLFRCLIQGRPHILI